MEERNLLSINSGSEQVVQWIKRKLFQWMESLNERDERELISFITNNRSFSGCQTIYFVLFRMKIEGEEKSKVKELLINEKQRLFFDLQRQLMILQNPDFCADERDKIIHFFDPFSRTQRQLSNQVGTWSPPSVSHNQSSLESLSPSLATSDSQCETMTTIMKSKIHSILKEIQKMERQMRTERGDEKQNQQRIEMNLPPVSDCAFDILRSFLGEEKFDLQWIDIHHLSTEEIERIPKDFRYLHQKDVLRISLKESQIDPLVRRFQIIFSDSDSDKDKSERSIIEQKRTEVGLDLKEMVSPENLSKIERISSSSFSAVYISDLNLCFKHLRSPPAEIGQLKNLQSLRLDYNQLTSLPVEIGQLNRLQSLFVNSNQLTSLPVEIGQLTNLQTLFLQVNCLTSLPVEIGLLESLQTLFVHHNQLESLPAEIGQLKSLKYLKISNNKLTSIPKEIGQLSDLQTLNLYSNQLSSLPKEIGLLTNLKHFDVGVNKLKSLPKEIDQLTNLQSLNSHGNSTFIEELGHHVYTFFTNLVNLRNL